ncbi:MAG: SCO family protein [Pseudomonadota bacterium]
MINRGRAAVHGPPAASPGLCRTAGGREAIAGSIGQTVLLCLAFVAIVLVAFVYSMTRPPAVSTEQLREQGVVLWPKPRELNPFELEGAGGGSFANADFEGKWSYVFFGFTNCPDICPTSMAVMAQAKKQLVANHPRIAERFQGILVSVDPERDTRSILAAYVAAFDAGFLGLRGEREAVAALATDVNVAFAKMPSTSEPYTIDHTGNIVIINPKGHYHGFIKLPHQADTLVATAVALGSTL